MSEGTLTKMLTITQRTARAVIIAVTAAGAALSGACPGFVGTLPSPVKVASRIFCCDSVRLTLARSGLPSGTATNG